MSYSHLPFSLVTFFWNFQTSPLFTTFLISRGPSLPSPLCVWQKPPFWVLPRLEQGARVMARGPSGNPLFSLPLGRLPCSQVWAGVRWLRWLPRCFGGTLKDDSRKPWMGVPWVHSPFTQFWFYLLSKITFHALPWHCHPSPRFNDGWQEVQRQSGQHGEPALPAPFWARSLGGGSQQHLKLTTPKTELNTLWLSPCSPLPGMASPP